MFQFDNIAKLIGIPAAMLAVALWSIWTKKFFPAWMLEMLQAERERERQVAIDRIANLIAEKDFWRAMALRSVSVSERAMDTAQRTVEVLPSLPLLPQGGKGGQS